MGFTDNQKKAIKLRDRDILVSAAAGSGKTSVLVERIIERICDDTPHVDVDRLLVMTFTNAAASEMKSRICDAIDKRIEEAEKGLSAQTDEQTKITEEYYDNLKRQSVLVHNAKIATIHGFCQSIVRDHFEEIGIDPTFRVADANECNLMRMDAVEECLEEAYENGDSAFYKAVEAFSGRKSDEELKKVIFSLLKFAESYPVPAEFLDKCRSNYEYETFEDFGNSDFVNDFLALTLEKVWRLEAYIDQARKIIDETDAIEGYRVTIDALADFLAEVAKALMERNYDRTAFILSTFQLDRIKTITDKGLSLSEIEARERVKTIRDIVKGEIGTIAKVFSDSLEHEYERMTACREEVGALCAVTARLGEIYSAKKRDKNIIDFGDMEHMAIEILQNNPEVADGYKDMYEEIYIDEYQDSNLTQETLVNLVKRDSHNVFCVGDVKQSIYRFRMARPDLFLSKYENYSDEDSKQQRVILNDNFRSRREVIYAVNEIFSEIMKKEFGKIEYDEKASLKYASTYYDECADCGENNGFDYKAEIMLGIPKELSDREFEANMVANRINEMVRGKMQVYDRKTGGLRDVRYSDFVILLRALKGWEVPFREVLMSAGIPVSITGSEGYFDTMEVRTALSFLSIVDNPFQDIPLATVMRSPIGGFSDEMMACVSISQDTTPHKSFYEKVLYVSQSKECEDELHAQTADRCKELIQLINRYREYSSYMSVSNLLEKFIDEEYGDYLRMMTKGAQRMANINMLLAKAEEFGRTSYSGLYNFMRYMEQIRKYEIDFGEAGILGENDNVVRIMTIHKSKGLEFPICFVAGIEKKRNIKSESANVVLDATYGLGCKYTDVDRRIKKDTLLRRVISNRLKVENLAEEMRVLYVAMTRAREKLIMVGIDKEERDFFEKHPDSIEKCSSYVDLLSYASLGERFDHFDVKYVTEEDIVAARVANEIAAESGRDVILRICRESLMNSSEEADERLADLTRRLDYKYPYRNMPKMAAKLSVSDLKHRAIEEKRAAGEELTPDGMQLFKETEPEKYIPKFMREEGQTERGGTFYGTAFHRILELWEYETDDVSESDVSEFAGQMLEKNRMDSDQVAAIKPADIAFFLNSELGRRMRRAKQANRLYREQPFVIGACANKIYPEMYEECNEIPTDAEKPDNPIILVQGIIDAYFIEDEEIVIVDYKTDYVTDAGMLISRYKTQLEYYATALSQITGRRIKSLIIYSSKLREEITL